MLKNGGEANPNDGSYQGKWGNECREPFERENRK